jgi:hypothetical protein
VEEEAEAAEEEKIRLCISESSCSFKKSKYD